MRTLGARLFVGITILACSGCNRHSVSSALYSAPSTDNPSTYSKVTDAVLAVQYPADQAKVFSSVHIVANATTQVGIERIAISVDGSPVFSSSSGLLDRYIPVNDGQHVLVLQLFDTNGNVVDRKSLSVSTAADTCGASSPGPGSASFPALLSQTCLYSNISTYRVSESLRPYAPQFPLWTDGAGKQRWIYLPPDSQIDTSDMENWNFPVGTRLFKEFVRDGKRVETRMIAKIVAGTGASSWVAGTYAWRADQTEADFLTAGATNALGTAHDIPSTTQCLQCHSGSKDFALGFDALQLSKSVDFAHTDLGSLGGEALMTSDPGRRFQIRGSAATQAAVGYLHANCASCHNPNGTAAFLNINFKHNLAAAGPLTENAYVTGLAQGKIVVGSPTTSPVILRMSERPSGMPALGSKIVDPNGIAAVSQWIAAPQ